MTAFRHANLLVRFLLELAAFTAIGWSVFAAVDGALAFVAAPGAVALAVTAWGALVAPRAPIALPLLGRLAVETAVFGAAVVGLIGIDRRPLGILLGICAAVNRILLALREP